ncbi:MAG TPA: TrmH family RNA methyltransferase [Armatimonadetes bacterium]|nr:TrmH family RNA methyltransferase [Armatimonadota bacterium]
MRKLTQEEIAARRLTLGELQRVPRHPIYAVLDNIRSMWNVGSIFRTSDGARVTKVILCGITAQPPRPQIEKTALGSVESTPWMYYRETMDAIRDLKARGVRILVLEQTDESVNLFDLAVEFPVALVVGHEVWGIQEAVLAEADYAAELPMYGVKHSLNVAVAYGIAVYELVRQYQGKITAGGLVSGQRPGEQGKSALGARGPYLPSVPLNE